MDGVDFALGLGDALGEFAEALGSGDAHVVGEGREVEGSRAEDALGADGLDVGARDEGILLAVDGAFEGIEVGAELGAEAAVVGGAGGGSDGQGRAYLDVLRAAPPVGLVGVGGDVDFAGFAFLREGFGVVVLQDVVDVGRELRGRDLAAGIEAGDAAGLADFRAVDVIPSEAREGGLDGSDFGVDVAAFPEQDDLSVGLGVEDGVLRAVE